MKLNKKHLVYLTVLAIGGGWLTMDCLTGSAPGESAASAAVTASEQVTENTGPIALAADMGDEPLIAARLDKLSQSRHLSPKAITNGFALPAAFNPAPAAVATNVPHVTAVGTFTHSHTLTSVMVGGRGSSVLVDGKTFLKIGDKLDGFALADVTKNSAVFKSANGVNAILDFNFPGASLATASIQGQ